MEMQPTSSDDRNTLLAELEAQFELLQTTMGESPAYQNDADRELGDVIQRLQGILGQMNVLALNAAIQASAAGEQGRGFKLVVDEWHRQIETMELQQQRLQQLFSLLQRDDSSVAQQSPESVLAQCRQLLGRLTTDHGES